MFEKIIAFSVKNKLLILIFTGLLCGAGIWSIHKIPLDAVPDITNNQVQVVTVSPSTAPQEVEKFITYPLELSLANLPDVVEIRSISRFGLSVITLVFKEDIPILSARQLVSEQIAIAGKEIPNGLGTPELMPITTGLGEIYQYTLQVDDAYQQEYNAMYLREIQDWIVKRQLTGIQGVIEVSSFGGYLKQLEVAVDPHLLQNFNFSIADVFTALEHNNQNSGASYIEKDNRAYYIRTEGLARNAADIEWIAIGQIAGRPIHIRDIGKVGYGTSKRFGAMTKDGLGETVGGIVLMLKGANSYSTIERVKTRVEEIQASLPAGIQIVPYLERTKLIDKAIATVSKNLLEGGLIVIFVLVLLLGNLRAGLIVASTIPLSMLFALFMMNMFGVSANLMSLGAIDFGIVVDGAVIITESVLHLLFAQYAGQHLDKKTFDGIIIRSSSAIYKSAAFGVLIILVVFLPILTLEGTEGKMFRPMAQTVSFAILGAFLLSATYVPVVSSLFLNRKINLRVTLADKVMGMLRKIYKPSLSFALNKPILIIAATVFGLVSGIVIFNGMGAEFTPTLEEGDLAMQMALKPGSSLTLSIGTSTQAEKILMDNFPEVDHVVSKIGTAEVPTDPMAIEDADIMIILKEKEEWTTTKDRNELIDLMKEKLSVIEHAEFEFTQPIQLRFNELMTGAKSDVAIHIFGEDLDMLAVLATKVAELVKPIQGAADVKVEKTEGLPQIQIRYNRAQMAYYGVDISEVNKLISSTYAGEVAGSIFEGERKFDLVVRSDIGKEAMPDLSNHFIKSSSGQMIPLSELADLVLSEGPMQISRFNTRRRINVGVNVRDRDVATLVEEIRDVLQEKITLPPGYYFAYGGEFEKLEAASARLKTVVPIALFLIFILLFFAFGSAKYALLIFSAVPLSAIGGIFALWIRDMPFSISAGVGFIALFGVAVLNGIVLISHFNELKNKGITDIRQLVIEGGAARLRPVLMTALVASMGFLPMALSTSAGAEVQKPLATVVIGGLVSATLLTLILLPVLYFLIERKSFGKKGITSVMILLAMFTGFQASAQNQASMTISQLEQRVMDSHPLLTKAKMATNQLELEKNQVWELAPLHSSWQWGEINYGKPDHFLTVNQDLGNLFMRIRKASELNQRIVISNLEHELIKKQLIYDVRLAFGNWYFSQRTLGILQQYHAQLERLNNMADGQLKAGEISELEHGLLKLQYARIAIQLRQQQTIADQAKLEVYNLAQIPIETTLDSSGYFDSQTNPSDALSADFLHFYDAQNTLSQHQESVQKAGYFPELSIGYFNQSLENVSGFTGYTVGVSLPIWAWANKSRIEQVKLNTMVVEQQNNFDLHSKQNRLQSLLDTYQQTNAEMAILIGELTTINKLNNLNGNNLSAGEYNFLTYFQQQQFIIDTQLNFTELQKEKNRISIEIKYLNE